MEAEKQPNTLAPPATTADHVTPTPRSVSPAASRAGASSVSSRSSLQGVDVEKVPTPADQQPPRKIHGFKWACAVLSVLAVTFLFALDNTIVADIRK